VLPGRDVTGWSLMGEIEVLVSPDTTMHLSGASVMGERKVEVVGGTGPVVHLDAVAVMGSVKVTHGGVCPCRERAARSGSSGGRQRHRRWWAVRPRSRRGVGPAGSPARSGPPVNVRSLGGFGSVTILTQSEADRQNVDD